jgi:hypothetical protein
LVGAVVLVLQEEVVLVLLGGAEVGDLIVVGVHYTAVVRDVLVLEHVVELLNTLVSVLLLVVLDKEAALAFELSGFFVLEEEPGIPLFHEALVLHGSAGS